MKRTTKAFASKEKSPQTGKELIEPSDTIGVAQLPSPFLQFKSLPAALIGKTTLDQLNTFLEALDYESDRGLVLTIAAICDDLCEQWLKEIFCHGNSDVRKSLFGFPGPFSSFSGRIKALYAHGTINAELFTDLEIIRSLRNDCAHKWASFEFTSEVVRTFVDPLFRDFVHIGDTVDGLAAIRTPQHKMRWVAFRLIVTLSQRKL